MITAGGGVDRPDDRSLMHTISGYLSRIGNLLTDYSRAVDLAVLDRLIETYPFQAKVLLWERERREAIQAEEEK